MYAILDDQSNKSLAKSTFFNMFGIRGPSSPYSLRTCTGTVEMVGRKATAFNIESIDGRTCLPLPTLIKCNQIPDHRVEIPMPDAAMHQPHLRCIVHLLTECDEQAQITLLLGRDILHVHKVREKINSPHNAPYTQRCDLGWVIIGDVCLGDIHKPTSVSTMFTNTLDKGRPSLFQPCRNHFLIKELPNSTHVYCPFTDPDCDNHAYDNY